MAGPDSIPPPSPEAEKNAKKAPDRQEEKESQVTTEAVKASGRENNKLAQQYSALRAEADAKKPPGYDPAKFSAVEIPKIPSPKFDTSLPGVFPAIFKEGGLEKAGGEVEKTLRAGTPFDPLKVGDQNAGMIDINDIDAQLAQRGNAAGAVFDKAMGLKFFKVPAIPLPGSGSKY